MNTSFAFCAIVLAGWVSPWAGEPVSPTQASNALSAGTRPARATSEVAMRTSQAAEGTARPSQAAGEGAVRPSRMPVAPTDPQAFSREDLPLPPTMNHAGALPSGGGVAGGPRYAPAGPADNGNRRSAIQKPFDNYRTTPATSPYMLINGTTNNGTVSPYMAYVRPAEDQQRTNQELEAAAGGWGNAPNPPAPNPLVSPNYIPYPAYYGGQR